MRTAVPLLIAALLGGPIAAPAQVNDGGAHPIGESGSALSDYSTNVHTGSTTLREGSIGSMHSGPVSEGSIGGMLSGPVSEISVGPVSASSGIRSDLTVSEASIGAVKKDRDSQLGERISEPLRDLGPLREQLRAIQPLARATSQPGEDEADAGPRVEQLSQSEAAVAEPESASEEATEAPATSASPQNETADTAPAGTPEDQSAESAGGEGDPAASGVPAEAPGQPDE